jgi:hypothetical protein
MVKVEFVVDGVNVGPGTILPQGKDLAYTVNGERRIATIGRWFIAPSTLNDPEFKRALWHGLTASEREAATTRQPST